MDPYATLGVSRSVNEEQLKRAYRKQAMKWHPDRAGSSAQSTEQFQNICHAYQLLSARLKEQNQQKNDTQGSGRASATEDGVFQEVMLEFAISLVRAGSSRQALMAELKANGCDDQLAQTIAQQAFGFQQESSTRKNSNQKTSPGHADSAPKPRKYDYYTIQALRGEAEPDNASRKAIIYYQDVFNELSDREQGGALISISKNRYLAKIFNRSMLLFALIAALYYYQPGLTGKMPMQWIDWFQLPSMLLVLMLVWSASRKLWLLGLFGLLVFSASQLIYYVAIPAAMEKDFSSVVLVMIISYLPFLLLIYLSNLFYFIKSKHIVASVNQHFPQLEEKLILIRNLAGKSRVSAALMALLLALYFLQMIPQQGSLEHKINAVFSIDTQTESRDLKQLKARISESKRLFQIGEKHFHRQPPNYSVARKAYMGAAINGSLLSCYKLGYMYLTGTGGTQDSGKAFAYFKQAVDSSLSSQPHNLSLATTWLAESYKTLGILYQGGFGVKQNATKAKEMFRQAVKYAPNDSVSRQLLAGFINGKSALRWITAPDFSTHDQVMK